MIRSGTLVALVGLTISCGLAACEKEGERSSGSLAGALLGGREVVAAGLKFEVPVTWNPGVPTSQMRAAQVVIPGDAGAAELAVFHFGEGQGGRVEDNLVRWISQIEVPQGEGPKREYFESNGFAVTMLSAAGTLKPSTMGMGPTEAQPDSMLLAAVVEGPGGPWFFKATGPEKTLDPQRDAFVAMLRSARGGG